MILYIAFQIAAFIAFLFLIRLFIYIVTGKDIRNKWNGAKY